MVSTGLVADFDAREQKLEVNVQTALSSLIWQSGSDASPGRDADFSF
jgi:hypothetical protein